MKKEIAGNEGKLSEVDATEIAADTLLREFSHSLGYGALDLAVKAVDLTPESFDPEDRLTDEAAAELYRLVGEFIINDGETLCDSMLNNLTRAQLNLMRQAQGMPPVKPYTAR